MTHPAPPGPLTRDPHTREPRATDADLEAFLDGALADAEASTVAAGLREDPGLRSRLAAITRADTLARAVLMEEPGAAVRRVRSPLLGGLVAAAAGVAILASIALLRARPPQAAPPGAPAPVLAANDDGGLIRVVLAIPAGARRTADRAHVPLAPDAVTDDGVHRRDEPAVLLASDDPAERAAAYRQLGEVIRSAAAANAALDALPPAEQLEACRLWADDPRLRPAVFPRLRTLADHPDLTDDLAIVLADLNNRPDLRGWLASHDLLAAVAPKPAQTNRSARPS